MNCYNHHDQSAIGICKSCHKGICEDCLTDVGNGIACSASCVEDVKALNALVNKNKQAHVVHNAMPLFYILVGALFLVGPYMVYKRFDPFAITFGALLISFGIFRFFALRK
ncbi:MAG: hypothetical protein V4638_11850 [Bacteroidota bacterium]